MFINNVATVFCCEKIQKYRKSKLGDYRFFLPASTTRGILATTGTQRRRAHRFTAIYRYTRIARPKHEQNYFEFYPSNHLPPPVAMSSFLTKLAHNSRISLAPKDTKGLQELIATEKRLIESVTKTASDRNKSSVALRDWGAGEGPDLGDVLAKVAILFQYVATAETQFSEHDATFRLHFKAIRTREESLAMLKRKRDSLASSIESQEKKVGRMKEEHRDLPVAAERLREMRQEMIGTENTVTNEETRLADYKRTTTREALSLKVSLSLSNPRLSVANERSSALSSVLCCSSPRKRSSSLSWVNYFAKRFLSNQLSQERLELITREWRTRTI